MGKTIIHAYGVGVASVRTRTGTRVGISAVVGATVALITALMRGSLGSVGKRRIRVAVIRFGSFLSVYPTTKTRCAGCTFENPAFVSVAFSSYEYVSVGDWISTSSSFLSTVATVI